MRTVMTAKARQLALDVQDDPAPVVLPIYAILTLIGCAMAESLALFGIVIYLLSANGLAMIASAIGLLIIATRFPTEDKLAGWIANLTGQRYIPPHS
jgi:hypothetical protein